MPTYLTSHVSKYGRRRLEAAVAELGLHLEHHGILMAVDDFGPLSQQELADCLDVDKSHLVRPIDQLEAAGHRTRMRQPEDRRRNRIALTDAGHALVAELAASQQRSQRGLLDPLSTDEQQTLLHLLRRVLDANDHGRFLETGAAGSDPTRSA